MDDMINKRAREWTFPPFDAVTIDEIKSLLDKNNQAEINDRFYTILEFGTGGLRGVIGAGTNRMNIYTVGMTSQGLANYISRKPSDKKSGIVVARDSRRMSREFAMESASIFAANGIQVYYFNDITPTPFTSFAIRELKAVSGVVVTASHNPPEYNGYKVYWEDGAQIISPQDTEIINEVGKISSIKEIKKINFDDGVKSGIIKIIDEEITLSYIKALEDAAYRKPSPSDIRIAYTPLHGTGYRLIPRILKHFGFSNVAVEERQSVPDGNFPTVNYPNPEEKDAMELILALGEREKSDIILATDPDADRMGVGFRDETGKFILINGNQIGSMLEYYLLLRGKEDGKLPGNCAVVKTIVTTDLQRKIAESFNCAIIDVLTGFKYIADRMKTFEKTGSHTYIFGGEESYGYLPVRFVRDKDAVSSCYFFAEMASWLQGKGMTLKDLLNEIYDTFGLYTEDLHSLTLKGIDGIDKIRGIMDHFRKNPQKKFIDIDVDEIADIDSLKSRNIKTGKAAAIENLERSNVIQFFLADGSKITLRPSGTEPKIKFYFSVNSSVRGKVIDDVLKVHKEKIAMLKKDLMEKINAI